jgi:hypothetical protein
MLLRNFKSTQDELSKRSLADELLQVEINNNSILDERISKYQDKNAPPPVPPEYKSQNDILKDTIKLERDAIDGVMEIGFSYGDASQIVSKQKSNGRLVELVQGLPFIKSDLQKKFNPKLLSVAFVEGYLQNYFDELGVSFGFAFDKAGGMDISTISEIKQILPQPQDVEALIDLLQSVPMAGDIAGSIIIQLQNYLDYSLTPAEETKLNTGNMTPRTRQAIFKRIKNVITSAGIPTPLEIREAGLMFQRAINDGSTEIAFNQLGVHLANRVSGMTRVKLKPLESIANDINSEVPSPGAELVDLSELEPDDPNAPPFEILPFDEASFNNNIKYIEGLINRQEWRDMNDMIQQVLTKVGRSTITSTDGTSISLASLQKENDGTKKSRITLYKKAEGLVALMREILDARVGEQPYYSIDAHEYYEDPNDTSIGFGIKSKTAKALANHFVEDERLLKKTGKAVAKMKKQIEYDSSSDEEVMKVLKKHSKAEKPLEKAIGAGYIHKRIPIKKIVGKGIEVEEQPTYRTFGKYVMHIPHLTEKNVLNLKYPSLGSIPSIKPMTISEDFKDFVIDVMNTGRVNDKAYNSLQPHEQKHFERITKGAGLIDTFKLKRSGDDDEKEEVDRFNLLRGNYLGGNNSPDVLKELKGLVVKFINDGRIARNEGLNLLMELSI